MSKKIFFMFFIFLIGASPNFILHEFTRNNKLTNKEANAAFLIQSIFFYLSV